MQNSYSPIFKILKPLLFLYRWGSYLRRFMIKGKIPPIPVISVGNLAFGGSGKTPVTIAIANYLKENGVNLAIGSLGYGGKIKGEKEFPPEEPIDPYEVGDEPALLRLNLPWAWIFVGKKREKLAEMALKRGVKVLLLDDGFQYIKLKKIEIVLHSQKTPKFYLREAEKALSRAHLLLVPEDEEWPSAFYYRLFPEGVPQKRVFAFCGIARAENFLSLFPDLGGHLTFPDHHRYKKRDLEKIYSLSEGLPIYTTEKDFVKIKVLENYRGGIFPIKWRAKIQTEFFKALEEYLKSWPCVLK